MTGFRNLLVLTALALTLPVMAGNEYRKSRAPEWLGEAVIYHIYPSTYQDSDGNTTITMPTISAVLLKLN